MSRVNVVELERRAVAAGDAELADKLAAEHAAQIVRQIQSYIARDTTSHISLAS